MPTPSNGWVSLLTTRSNHWFYLSFQHEPSRYVPDEYRADRLYPDQSRINHASAGGYFLPKSRSVKLVEKLHNSLWISSLDVGTKSRMGGPHPLASHGDQDRASLRGHKRSASKLRIHSPDDIPYAPNFSIRARTGRDHGRRKSGHGSVLGLVSKTPTQPTCPPRTGPQLIHSHNLEVCP